MFNIETIASMYLSYLEYSLDAIRPRHFSTVSKPTRKQVNANIIKDTRTIPIIPNISFHWPNSLLSYLSDGISLDAQKFNIGESAISAQGRETATREVKVFS